jgi:hypothetical protein
MTALQTMRCLDPTEMAPARRQEVRRLQAE